MQRSPHLGSKFQVRNTSSSKKYLCPSSVTWIKPCSWLSNARTIPSKGCPATWAQGTALRAELSATSTPCPAICSKIKYFTLQAPLGTVHKAWASKVSPHSQKIISKNIALVTKLQSEVRKLLNKAHFTA